MVVPFDSAADVSQVRLPGLALFNRFPAQLVLLHLCEGHVLEVPYFVVHIHDEGVCRHFAASYDVSLLPYIPLS